MARAALAPVYTEVPSMGVDGRTVLAGARTPLVTDGRVGDFWVDTASKKLYGPKSAGGWPDKGLIRGAAGWYPLERIVNDGARRVTQVYDWAGGEGAKPATGYKTAAGAVSANIADGVDIRGAEGPAMLVSALPAPAGGISYATLIAAGVVAGDNEKRSVADLFVPGAAMSFASVAAATAATVPSGIKVVNLQSYADGIGSHRRRRVAAEPDHAGKHRSADRFTPDGGTDSVNGGWWEIDEAMLLPQFFGAKADNSNDDTDAIQAAVDCLCAMGAGGVVHLVRGIYKISDEIVVPSQKSVLFLGDGPKASILRQSDSSANGIVFNNDDYTTMGGGVQRLSIEAGDGFNAAQFFGLGSIGIGIKAVHMNAGWSVNHVDISNFADGLVYLSCWNTNSSDVQIRFFTGNGVLVDASPDGSVGGGNKITAGAITNNGFTGSNAASAGIRIKQSGGEFFKAIDITSVFNGVKIDPASGKLVAYVFFEQVLADTSAGDGWLFDGAAGAITRITTIGCWGSFGSGNGLVTKGAGLRGLRMTNMGLRENKLRGWHHQGGSNIELIGPDINSNSRTNPNVYSGVKIEAGQFLWSVIGGRIGNAESATEDQAEAIIADGAQYDIRVVGVDMNSPGAGKACFVYDEDQLADCYINGNLPSRYGMNFSARYVLNSGAFLGANAAAFFGPSGSQPNPGTVPWRVARKTRLAKLHLFPSSAPGVGQTFTYRAYVNGVAVGSPIVISGAAVTAAAKVDIVLSPNDYLDIQAVSSATAAGAVQNVMPEMEPA